MAGPGPWSVKGIDDETRAVAREAASRAGLPIGAWLDRAILKATDVGPSTGPGVRPTSPTESATPPAPSELPNSIEEPPPVNTPPEPATAAAPSPFVPAPEAERPAASPLDAPPPIAERVAPVLLAADRSRPTNEVMRYGLGGAAALLVIVAGITLLDRVALAPDDVAGSAVRTARTETAPPAPSGSTAGTVTRPAEPSGDPVIAALTARASGGDADAQFDLGMRYGDGKGIARDPRLAAEWLEKAAVRGLAPAQYNLGVLYEEGRGVTADPKLAYFWYHSAAENGFARAMHNLGTLFATGKGVPQNYAEAAKWFRRGADSGIAMSMYSLGLMHEHGLGVTRDVASARGHYQRAAAAGSADARSKLAALGPGPAAAPPPRMAAEAERVAAVAPAAGKPASEPGTDAGRALDRREMAELQRLLARLDFAPGSADGVAGRRTVAAIKLYQEFAGLPVDGKATRGLLDDLRQVAQTLRRQPQAATR